MFARIENNVVVEWPIQSLQQLFPHTSFPMLMNDAAVPDGYAMVHKTAIPQAPAGKKVVEDTPVFNGKWVQAWRFEDLSEEEKAAASVQAQAGRINAYREEADPLFFKWQRGEATQQDWLDKIAEIKARHSAG
jgi:hypothetical protein